MTQQGVRWTADQVLALAPDAASRKAGSRLGAAGPWSEAGSSDEGTVWGLCKGSGSKPYQTVIDIAEPSGPAYKCSCPSRKFPCKHALGLLLLWAGGDGAVAPGQPPDWAEQWIKGRRQRAEEKRTASAPGSASGAADPEAARRRAERRAVRVTAGATELEQRLADLLRGGLAGAEQAGYGLGEETAARMVDAQAPGLAARVRELGAIPASGPGWPVRLLEECALLHLLDQGWLRRELLPDGLADTVRSRVGLPASADGPPVRDRWLVLAQYDTADVKLTTRRIWLYGADSGRTALLLSYGAAGRAPELALPVGLALEAEVSAYPGAGQLRAALGEQFAPPAPTAIRPPGVTTAEAAARYGEALRGDPWLDSVPVTLDRVVPTPDGDSWQLADADADTALPLTPAARARPGLWRLVALSGGAPVKVFGECGHRGFTPLTAWAEGEGEVVQLC
ncbi:SWIM zinc finger family protein [Streptomyces sp. ISL-22]|uniref:SWIM zinc finger family protein n=1 Tax=unclassified Streptomyces TaxID=2593676 RepID=UPI001BEAE1A5|nr:MULTISPECIES: SWIM zinc finger family protein [unclassified Streptomyces]MBT2421407.1 SWIM zinc finger family protein [Streptomyces sp. ISL-24]MBT2430712.1 SWIM zinc finger family protein [Streptomyces sp. ISL-22]